MSGMTTYVQAVEMAQPIQPCPPVQIVLHGGHDGHDGHDQQVQQGQSEKMSTSMPKRSSVLKELLLLLAKIASIILVFVLLFTFLFGIIRYQDTSMTPAIKAGDLVVFYRYATSGYQPQDVIVLDFHGQRQVRRVVATAGDTVDITSEGLVINGAPQQEREIYQKTERYAEGVKFPLTVPEGQVFVLGDSRTDASDSRIYGCVKIDDTVGKVMTVIRRRGI